MSVQPGMVVRAFGAGPRWVIVGVIVYASVVIVPMLMVVMRLTIHIERDGMQGGGHERRRRAMRMGGRCHSHPVACESKHQDEADDAPDERHASTLEAKDVRAINGQPAALKADYDLLNANPRKPRRSPVQAFRQKRNSRIARSSALSIRRSATR